MPSPPRPAASCGAHQVVLIQAEAARARRPSPAAGRRRGRACRAGRRSAAPGRSAVQSLRSMPGLPARGRARTRGRAGLGRDTRAGRPAGRRTSRPRTGPRAPLASRWSRLRGRRTLKWHQSGADSGQAASCGQGARTCAPAAIRRVARGQDARVAGRRAGLHQGQHAVAGRPTGAATTPACAAGGDLGQGVAGQHQVGVREAAGGEVAAPGVGAAASAGRPPPAARPGPGTAALASSQATLAQRRPGLRPPPSCRRPGPQPASSSAAGAKPGAIRAASANTAAQAA